MGHGAEGRDLRRIARIVTGGRAQRSNGRDLSALILAGGGARGAYECGVYKSLAGHGIDPEVLVGTSVGAINATAIAMGMDPDTLAQVWLDLATPDAWIPTEALRKVRALFGNRYIFRNRLDVWNIHRWTWLFDTRPLRKTLMGYFDPGRLARSKKTLLITAVDVQSGEVRVFGKDQISLEHVLASASLPVIFPWTIIGGRAYWDGGLLACVPPLKVAIEADRRVREVWLVKLFPQRAPRPRGLVDAIERAIEITLQGTLSSDIKHCEFVNDLIERGLMTAPYRTIRLHTIEFGEPLEAISIINFNRHHVERLIAQGRADTDAYLAREGVGRAGARRTRAG